MELHRVRSLTDSEKAIREKAVRPPMNSLASYYSSGSSSIAGMSDTEEEDEGEDSWQDALEYRSSSRSSEVRAGPAETVKSCVGASDRNEHTRQDAQEEDDDDSDLEPDYFRPAVQNPTAPKTTGHVAHGSIALDGVDIEALIASYRPLIHPAVAAHIDERQASILKSSTIVRSNSSPSTTFAHPSPPSSRPTSSSSSSVVASSSKDSFASARPNAISRKNSSSSFTSLFSRKPGSSNKLQKETSKQSKGKWVSGELPVYDEEGADKYQTLPPHMKRSASASVAGSSPSQSTPMYASGSMASTAASQHLQYRSFSTNDMQPSRASLSSQSKTGVISSNGDSPRSSLSSSSTGTTARSSTSAKSRGSFRWSVDSSASNATTKTSTSVPASQAVHANLKYNASSEKDETAAAASASAEGVAGGNSRRGSRHGHTISIDSLDDFDKDSISSKDFPAPPPLSRKNSTASSVFSLPSSSYTRPRNDSIASTTSASGKSQGLPLSNVVRSSPLSPGLSTGTQAGNPFFAMPKRKDSDTASIRSFASSASNLALPVHRVAPLWKAPSDGPASTQIRQRQASAPIITTSSSSMSSTALLPSSSASSFPTSGITSSAISASSSLPHEAYSYSQDYIPSSSDRKPQTQTQTLYRPPPQQQVLSSYKPSSGRPSIRRDATYPTYS